MLAAGRLRRSDPGSGEPAVEPDWFRIVVLPESNFSWSLSHTFMGLPQYIDVGTQALQRATLRAFRFQQWLDTEARSFLLLLLQSLVHALEELRLVFKLLVGGTQFFLLHLQFLRQLL